MRGTAGGGEELKSFDIQHHIRRLGVRREACMDEIGRARKAAGEGGRHGKHRKTRGAVDEGTYEDILKFTYNGGYEYPMPRIASD